MTKMRVILRKYAVERSVITSDLAHPGRAGQVPPQYFDLPRSMGVQYLAYGVRMGTIVPSQFQSDVRSA